jgi:hypothetical protein
LLSLPVDDENRWVACLHTVRAREPRGPVADEEHVPAVFHDRHCQVDRVPHVTHGAHATSPHLCTFHDARVELDITFQVETCPDARVEKGLILQLPHGGHRCGEGAIADERPARRKRSIDCSLALRALGHGHRPSAAMDDQSWGCHLDLA